MENKLCQLCKNNVATSAIPICFKCKQKIIEDYYKKHLCGTIAVKGSSQKVTGKVISGTRVRLKGK